MQNIIKKKDVYLSNVNFSISFVFKSSVEVIID